MIASRVLQASQALTIASSLLTIYFVDLVFLVFLGYTAHHAKPQAMTIISPRRGPQEGSSWKINLILPSILAAYVTPLISLSGQGNAELQLKTIVARHLPGRHMQITMKQYRTFNPIRSFISCYKAKTLPISMVNETCKRYDCICIIMTRVKWLTSPESDEAISNLGNYLWLHSLHVVKNRPVSKGSLLQN